MKKIMFNDRYGLTNAVLSGRKTMTRRIISGNFVNIKDFSMNGDIHIIAGTCYGDTIELKPKYEIGEKVAIAQSYKSVYDEKEEQEGNSKANEWWSRLYDLCKDDKIEPMFTPGYRNKFFVRADLMPHHIRIINIKVERLQDISNEDCLKEGVEKWNDSFIVCSIMERGKNNKCFFSPRDAFNSLINRVGRWDTWVKNPWVMAYEFRLID